MTKLILTKDSVNGACELAQLKDYPNVVAGTGSVTVTPSAPSATGKVTYTVSVPPVADTVTTLVVSPTAPSFTYTNEAGTAVTVSLCDLITNVTTSATMIGG